MRVSARFASDRLAALAALLVLAACTTTPAPAPAPPSLSASAPVAAEAAPAAPVPTPAESALAQGVKAYQAQYTVAETQLKNALQLGLTTPADVASAHKHLAFVYCTSRREALCAAAFKAARAADPDFALTKSEAGHPMWGPVYRKALPAPKPAKAAAAVKPRS